jgi:hypothetical protein
LILNREIERETERERERERKRKIEREREREREQRERQLVALTSLSNLAVWKERDSLSLSQSLRLVRETRCSN